jgi:hypothetical protein
VGDDRKQDLAQLLDRMNELDARNRDLEQRLAEVAQVNVISDTLFNGFHSVIEELRPLRDLTPQRTPVEDGPAFAAAAMLAAMQGVTLPGGSLKVQEANVPYIGSAEGLPLGPDQPEDRPGNPDQVFVVQVQRPYQRGN